MLHVWFPCWFWHAWYMHVCIWFICYHWHGFFLVWQWFLALPCHFQITMVWWVSFLVELWIAGRFLDLGEVASGKSQGLRVEMVFSRKPSTCGWRQENYSRDGEGIMRYPSLIWFCDLGTRLGEIMIAWGWRCVTPLVYVFLSKLDIWTVILRGVDPKWISIFVDVIKYFIMEIKLNNVV